MIKDRRHGVRLTNQQINASTNQHKICLVVIEKKIKMCWLLKKTFVILRQFRKGRVVGLGWLLFTRPDSPEAGFMKQLCSPLMNPFWAACIYYYKVYREAAKPGKKKNESYDGC